MTHRPDELKSWTQSISVQLPPNFEKSSEPTIPAQWALLTHTGLSFPWTPVQFIFLKLRSLRKINSTKEQTHLLISHYAGIGDCLQTLGLTGSKMTSQAEREPGLSITPAVAIVAFRNLRLPKVIVPDGVDYAHLQHLGSQPLHAVECHPLSLEIHDNDFFPEAWQAPVSYWVLHTHISSLCPLAGLWQALSQQTLSLFSVESFQQGSNFKFLPSTTTLLTAFSQSLF